MKTHKLSIIISIVSAALAVALSLVLYFVLKPTPDNSYIYFKQNSLELNLYQEIELDDIEIVTNIDNLDNIAYSTNNDTVEIDENKLVAKAVGSDKLTCSVEFNNKTYTASIDLLVKFDGIDSVLQVSVDATKQDNAYVLYLPNKNYTSDNVNNCADIDITFLDNNFISEVSYSCIGDTDESSQTFNNAHSFDNNVINVQDDKVRAIGLGKATLVVNFVDTNLSTSIDFVVKQIMPTQVVVDGGDLELSLGQSQVAIPNVTVLPEYATIKTYSIDIEDTSIVVQNGQNLQILSEGNTTITFNCGNVSKTINVVVSAVVDRLEVSVLEEFVSNSVATIEYALYCGSTQINGEVGVLFLYDGDELEEVEFVYYYEIFANTIDFDLGDLEDFTIRIYCVADDSIYQDIEVIV